ncbi:HNH/ENDO VII family nuclease [Tessaracoccus sp. OS52]|uniref:GH-E family nuclease n=1 Tax=Tessaracoccus sp. OS52 TaxID=2886691 RepID=UPI001D126BCD|nr:GH-E family nuclease [Tessaracoccus sp. OS52]MCC2591913.1 HNH/ENDO VII family nuclease [Tessaracoccus sp. OS52]
MAKYPKKIVELANGGIFQRVIAKNFHFTKATREAIDQVHRRADDLARKNPVTGKRQKYVGSTPSKSSRVGQDVIARMHSEGRIRGWNPALPDRLKRVEVLGPDGRWHKVDTTDMGHVPIDAVTYWNNVGRYHGPKSPEVRAWMNDPNNYELQPGSVNQADGRIMGASGFAYQPPVQLPPGVDIVAIEADVLDQLKNFKGKPIP